MTTSIEPPIWGPDREVIGKTHLADAMRVRGFDDYTRFHAWSVNDPEGFLGDVLNRLAIRFAEPPRQMLDVTRGVCDPDWLVGAKLNIAESCFNAPGDATAIVEGHPCGAQRTLTYDEVRCFAYRVAHGLRAMGLEPGDPVAVFLPMIAESVPIYLGIVLSGCVVVSIADSFSESQVGSRLKISGAKAVFTVSSVRRGAKRLGVYDRLIGAGGPRAIVLPGDEDEPVELRAGDINWSDFLSDTTDNLVRHMPPDAAVNILFSSGTTGDPKAIVWDHVTPIKAAIDAYYHHDLHESDVVAWPTNLGWMMGPWLIFATMINRATIALYTGPPTEPAFMRFIESARVSVLGLVPSMVRHWRANGLLDGVDWTGIRAFSSTGECSNADDMRWLSEQAGGRPIIEYCGGTEIGGGYITSTLVQSNFPSAFSAPAIGSDFVLLDESGYPTDDGEVFLIPPALGLSRRLLNRDHHETYYADCPRHPECGRPLRRHGDQIRRLPNGYYQTLGRADDTMNLGGIKVSAAEVERALAAQDGDAEAAMISEIAAIAVSPPGGGPSRLVVFIGCNDARPLDSEALCQQMRRRLKTNLNPLFRVEEVVVLEKLPRTASNKIMRRTLREIYFARQQEQPHHE